MTIPNNIYQEVTTNFRDINQDPLCYNNHNPGFWVGQAEGIHNLVPLFGETGHVKNINNITKTDVSNTIFGPNSVDIGSTVIDMSKLTITQSPKAAIKHDEGKTDWSLVPFEALEGMADVLTFGAKKYASWNWTDGGGFSYSRVLRSCLRHMFAFMRGEDNDPESGLSHISHAQCNLLFLAYYIRDKKKFNKDDRNVR